MLTMGMKITHASHLSDQELTTALMRLAQDEREATVALIVHLAEFDARRLYEPAGFSSLFQYCRAILRLSEDAVYNRIQSARAARRFPVIVDMLRARTLSPTTARLLARRLTPENHEELLSAASGLGKEEVAALLAARFPEPEVKASVRLLPMPPGAALPAHGHACGRPGGLRSDCPVPHPHRRLLLWRRVRPFDRSRQNDTRSASRPRRKCARDSVWRRICSAMPFRAATWPDRRSGTYGPHRRAVAPEVRGHSAPPRHSRSDGGLRQHPRRRPSRRLRQGRGPVLVRVDRRAPLWRAAVHRVPPRHPSRGGRQGDGREHPVTLSRPQRPRSRTCSSGRACADRARGRTRDALVPGRVVDPECRGSSRPRSIAGPSHQRRTLRVVPRPGAAVRCPQSANARATRRRDARAR